MPMHDLYHLPSRMRARFDEIVALTDDVATRFLDAEYAELCRRMTAELARKRPSPLERGEARTWAAGIVYAVGWVNFLSDPSQQPHLTAAELAAAAGVGQSTIAATFRKIKDALRLSRLDPEWTRPSELLENPLAWIVLVDGLPVDLRDAPREVQEAAFRRGLIPFVPATEIHDVDIPPAAERDGGPVPPPLAATPAIGTALAEAEDVLRQALAEHPDATVDELNTALQAATARYNRRPQADLGGLSPAVVQRLLDADWEGPDSAIRLDGSIPLGALESSRTLHNARLILAMLAERAPVKATPKGNLPRAFVNEFRERMRHPPALEGDFSMETRVLNEEDCAPLHLPRVLLELAGLAKRRKGVFSLTRSGERLRADKRAGELLTTLIRTHFRRLNLEYLDGAGPAPEFQYTIGYTLYQFGRAGTEWRTSGELSAVLVLPGVRPAVPTHPHFDVLALILETRFLRPLEGFGLAEERTLPRQPGELIARTAYRKTSLFDQVVGFRVAS
jgi:hypothetical protein